MPKGHRNAPGSYESKGVNCTMEPTFKDGLSGGRTDNSMAAPFNAPKASGGIPTKIYDTALGTTAARTIPGQVGPSQQGQKRTGTKEYPMGGGSMRDGKSSGRP